MLLNKNKKGFTIIEVALVMGIAGLVFLMVFVALPSLQRQARDAQRRDDIITLISAIKKYQTNNRGALPSEPSSEALSDYLPRGFSDPDGSEYNLKDIDCTKSGDEASCANDELTAIENVSFPNEHKMYIVKKATCDGASA